MPQEMYEIDDAERRHLQEMLKSPGYQVLQKIWAAYIEQSTEGTIALSKADPLANGAEIARKWAYVAIAEDVLGRMKAGIKFELDILKANATQTTSPERLEARRRHILLGELDPAPEA